MDSFSTIAFPTTTTEETTPVQVTVAAQETTTSQTPTVRKRRLSTGGVGTTYCIIA